MSVWFTETFRGQICWDWARLGMLSKADWRALVKRTDVDFAGGTLRATGDFDEVVYPKGKAADLAGGSSRSAKEFERIFWSSIREKDPAANRGGITQRLLRLGPTFTCGLRAVYSLFLDLGTVADPPMARATDAEHAYLTDFISHNLRSQTDVLKTNPKSILEAVNRMDTKALRSASHWYRLAGIVRNLITVRHRASYRKEMGVGVSDRSAGKLPNYTDEEKSHLPPEWTVLFDGWVTYVQTDRHEALEYYALSTADLDRVQQMCISRAMLELHGAAWSTTAGNDRNVYTRVKRQMLEVLTDAISQSLTGRPEFLCRNFRKIFNMYLSMAAGELSDAGTRAMMQECKREGYYAMIDHTRYVRILRSAPFDLAQDIGRLYKLLPAPDYDIGEGFVSRQKAHLSMNAITPLTGDNPCNMEEWRKYMRRHMIYTLVRGNKDKGVGRYRTEREPKWWRDYQNNGLLPSGLDVVDQIDLTGTAPYIERKDESVVSWKDSACCEEDLAEVEDDATDTPYKRNMLLRYLYDGACPTADSARRAIGRSEHVHRVGFKMEAHKPVSRLFFIGNLSDRLVQSEMEENVHRVALHSPGYMIGQTPEFCAKKTMSMVAPPLLPGEKVYFLNFDIASWSPGMTDQCQRMTHEIFGEVFNRPEFLKARRINEGATVVLNKRGYHGAYINPGANFEGYNGKEMTFMHCALMGYAVFRYRRATGHKLTANLCAYIDDGLASFKDDARHNGARFLKFVDVVEETYGSLGFILERSKCYLSDAFAIFLNEIYYAGQHVTYGLRAIMRVGTTTFEKHETLADKAGSYFAGTQGALKAGVDLVAGCAVYSWLIGRLLYTTGVPKYMDSKGAVLYALTPKALGGLGTPNLLSLISNLGTDGLIEGIATIQACARAFPAYKAKVVRLIRQEVAAKTDVAILLAPATVRDARAHMVEVRLRLAVAESLRKSSLAPKPRKFMRLTDKLDLDAFARSLLSESTTVVPALLSAALDATPYAILMSLVRKFDSARTMLFVVGRKRMNDVIRLNHQDAMHSISAFRFR